MRDKVRNKERLKWRVRLPNILVLTRAARLAQGDGSNPWGNGTTVNRQSNDTRYVLRDLEQYYLPAFKAAMLTAEAGSVMCAYQGVNGVPARPALLGSWEIPKVPPRLKCDVLRVKPSAQTHTDALHCSSHYHQFRVF